MAIGVEMPAMVASSYATSTYSPTVTGGDFLQHPLNGDGSIAADVYRQYRGAGRAQEQVRRVNMILAATNNQEELVAEKPKRRIVQVFIADPDENVPLESSVLYTGEQKLTDATDNELFFEIDINGILKAHNQKRITIVNKKVKDRTENLEPARVRDLKMVVVTIAEF